MDSHKEQQAKRQPNESDKTDIPKRPDMATVSLGVLILVTFFTSLYAKGLNSGIPLHYDSIGFSATVGGTFVAVFTLASTAMRLLGGQLTDHFSHYRVLLASLVGLLIGVLIPAVTDNFAAMMASRVLQGAGFALATNVMTVAVMGSASKKHLGRRVGLKGAGTSLGTMFGALVATGLLDGVGFQGFFVFYAVLMVLAIVVVALLHRAELKSDRTAPGSPEGADKISNEKKPAEAASAKDASAEAASAKAAPAKAASAEAASAKASSTEIAPLKTNTSSAATKGTSQSHASTKAGITSLIAPYLFPQVAPYLAISFARRVPRGFCIAFILVFARHVGIAGGATFFIVAGATTLACRLFGGKLFDSERSGLLLPIISVQIVGFAILCIAPSLPALLVAAVGYGFSIGMASPFVKTLTAKATPQEHWGVVNGEVYFFGDLGKALGAFVGGLIIDALGKSLVPEIALGITVFASIVTAIALIVGKRMAAHAH